MDELYPKGPTEVPHGFVEPTKSFRRLAWLSIAGLVVFVLVYASLTAWFAYKAVTLLWLTPAGSVTTPATIAVGILAALLAVFLATGLLAFWPVEGPEEVELTQPSQPELFAFVERLARETGAPMPHRIFLRPEVTAFVSLDTSLPSLLRPSRRTLGIGLGLVNVLTLAEFKAVLAHELGHFAQDMMASRYVYVGQRVASRVVHHRGAIDRLLEGASSTDLRIAWIGWIFRTIAWSVRSIIGSVFRMALVAERALSRKMELQADLVAVSVTGSDALIEALFRLRAGDDAFDRATQVAVSELGEGRRVPDVYALQDRVLHHRDRIVGKDDNGMPPKPKDVAPAEHRIFEPGIAQPPQMWATHPPGHVREDNAKRVYLPAPRDDRSAWVLFRDPDELRRRLTTAWLSDVSAPQQTQDIGADEAIVRLDDRYAAQALQPRYRGVYLGRRPAGWARQVADLYDALPEDPAQIRSGLPALYPEGLNADLRRWRQLSDEVAELEAIADGIVPPRDGIIEHRGEVVRRKDLRAVIDRLRRERDEVNTVILAHERRSRALHGAAAITLGHGWPEYLGGLASLLHYADHMSAELQDAADHYDNVFDVVFADGHLTERESLRLRAAGFDLHAVLAAVHEQQYQVWLPPPVLLEVEAASWPAMLPDSFDLPRPVGAHFGDFVAHVGAWCPAYLGALAALRRAALETLLRTEDYVARSYLEGLDPGVAPDPARVPPRYHVRLVGEQRPRQHVLDWWSRFQTADGWGPGLARFAVTGAIVAALVFVSGRVGIPEVVVHNGLQRTVVVQMDEVTVRLRPAESTRVELPVLESIAVHTRTEDGETIERFDATASGEHDSYVYNVAGAAALALWREEPNGKRARRPRALGAPRWLGTDADYLFEQPPSSRTSQRTTPRTVLEAVQNKGPEALLMYVKEPAQRSALIDAHARWDGVDTRNILTWLELSSEHGEIDTILAARLKAQPKVVVLRRFRQDAAADGGARARACAEDEAQARGADDDGDLQYLAARCIEDPAQRRERLLELHAKFPDNAWLSFAAGEARLRAGEWAEGLTALGAARGDLAVLAHAAAMSIARARRMQRGIPVSLSDLFGDAPELRAVESIEGASRPRQDDLVPYYYMARGELANAASAAADDPHALRLIAASDGVSDALATRALELPPPDPTDEIDLMIDLALARRAGVDVQARYGDTLADEALADLVVFTDAAFLRGDPAEVDAALASLDVVERGIACAAAVIVLGDDAPPLWRMTARRLLLPYERPWFRES